MTIDAAEAPLAETSKSPRLQGTDYVARAYAFVFGDLRRVLISAAGWMLPVLLFLMWPRIHQDSFAGVFQAIGSIMPSRLPDPATTAFSAAAGIMQSTCTVGFVVMRHRLILHQTAPIERRFQNAILPYLGYWLLAAIAFAVFVFVLMFVAGWTATSTTRPYLPFVQFVVAILGAVLILKSILVFPAIAIGDRSMTLLRSERLTQGSSIRIALSALATTLPVGVILGLWNAYAKALLSADASNFLGAVVITVSILLETVAVAVFVTYVSLVYARLTGRSVPEPEDWN